MTNLPTTIRDAVLARVPQDGSAIGNIKLLAALREQFSDLTEDQYHGVRDKLVDDGVLAKGRGRVLGAGFHGPSIRL